VQLGTENRNKVIIAGVLGVIALVTLGWQYFPSSSGPQAATVAPPQTPVRPTLQPTGKKTGATHSSLDPTLRYDWLKASEDTKYEGKGRNIFVAEAEVIPTPVARVDIPQPQPQPGPPQPPPPPPINLKFYGFASSQGAAKKVFLAEGDDIFIAGEGDIVDRKYKVLRIMPMAVEIEDVLNNNRQQIPLTQG
jgi:hypothetical protein